MCDFVLIGQILGVVAAALRVLTALIHFVRTIQDGRSFKVRGYIDPDGAIVAKVHNRSGESLQIQGLEIVEDLNSWYYALRMVTGLDMATRLNHLVWKQLSSLPATAVKNMRIELSGCLDSTRHNVTELRSRWIRKPMVKIEIGGLDRLVALKKVDAPMPLPGEEV